MALSQIERLVNWFKEVAVRRSLVEHATKKEFLQMMGTTKLHGCYRLYAGKTYGRLFWLLVAISTGVVFVIVLAELTKQYKAGNVRTQVEIVYDYADGPSLTICNHNPVRRNYIEELKRTTTFSDELLMYLLHIFLRPEGFAEMDVVDGLLDGERLLQDYMFTNKNFTVDSFVKEASFKCEEAFVQCAFEGIIFDCCNERYSTAVLTDFGFQVMLDYQSYNEIYSVNYTGSRIKQPFLNNFEPGFRIYVHDKDTVSYVSSEVLVVSPNNKLSAGLKPIKYQFLERSKGGTCHNTWPSSLRHNSTYSSSACKMACIARYFTVNCGCIPLQYNILKEGRLCSPKEVFDCISDFTEIASIVHNVTYSSLCQDCAPECELFIYFTQNSIIHNILTSLGKYMESLKQQYKLSYVRNNLATVHVFFASKKYKIYSQSTLSDLSGKIGSDMGLFYGASVISLFELILVLFKTVWALLSPSRAIYLKEKAKREMERKLCIEEIINEYSIPNQMVGHVPQRVEIPTIESVEVDDVHISHVKESLIGNVQLWLKRKLYSSFTLSVQRPRRKLDQVMSLTLTPEQASAILEVETFVDSIYVPLRRDKLLSTVGSSNSKRCISVV
uniref:Amiloride-sensitive sodium channel family protein n=1 Tax=Wuchereria bancrofti TaxID=6293 RepID=A0A1I8EDN5_WUCBA